MKYLLNRKSFIPLMVLFSFFDNFGMDGETEEENVTPFKVLFIGDAGVGKTQIISRILNNQFYEGYVPTIGVDFMPKNITFRGTNIKLQMWDTAGQEKYKTLITHYFRNSSIVFLIYDVSMKSSFNNIPNWITLIRSIENNTLVLCGNKIDLAEREVKKEEGEALAQKEGIAFFEVSAKTGEGIKDMFYSSVADLSIFNGYELNKESLVKELLQEKENKNENEKEKENENEKSLILINDPVLNTGRSSLCSRCIYCFENCFKSDEKN